MEKNPIVSVPDNRDLCSFFVTKHSWKGKYKRIFSIGTSCITTYHPGTMEVTNRWPYSDVINLCPVIPKVQHADATLTSGANELFTFTFMTRKRKSDTMKFSSEYRTEILCNALSFRQQFFDIGNRVRPAQYSCTKHHWSERKLPVCLEVDVHAVNQISAKTRQCVANYVYSDIDYLAIVSDYPSAFVIATGGFNRLHLFACVDSQRDELLRKICDSAWSNVGCLIRLRKDPITISHFQSNRFGRYSNDESITSLYEFSVYKITCRDSAEPSKRTLALTENCLLERDPNSYSIITLKPLNEIFALVRSSTNAQHFSIEYIKGQVVTYSSTDRDALLASLLDGVRASGNIDVHVKMIATVRGHRIGPYSMPVDEEVESWHLKFLQTPPQGWQFNDAVLRFNANCAYSGLLHSVTQDRLFAENKEKLIQIALGAFVEKEGDQDAISHQHLEEQFQCLRRLVASKAGFTAFTVCSRFRDCLGKKVVKALKRNNDAVIHSAIDMLCALMQPMHDDYDLRQEQLNKSSLLSSKEFLGSLLDVMQYHVDCGTGALVVASMLDLLTFALCPPYSETTDGAHFDVLLAMTASYGKSLFKLFQHPSLAIVKGAGLVMKAIIEEAELDTSSRMQALALAEGSFPKHLQMALFSPDLDSRYLAVRHLSRQLIALWSVDNSIALQLLQRVFPSGLLSFLESSEKPPANYIQRPTERNNLKLAEDIGARNRGNALTAVRELPSVRLLEKQVEDVLKHWREKIGAPKREPDPRLQQRPVVLRKRRERVKCSANWPYFFYQFSSDHARPDLIWNYKTREELRDSLEAELRAFQTSKELSSQQTALAWNHREFEVMYTSLNDELKIGDCYVRLLLEEGEKTVESMQNSNDGGAENSAIDAATQRFADKLCVRKPNEFFNELYHQFLLTVAQPLGPVCLHAMSIVYAAHHSDIGEFRDIRYLLQCLESTRDRLLRDRLLILMRRLMVKEQNVKQFLDADGVRTLVDLLPLAHLHVTRAAPVTQTNLIEASSDAAQLQEDLQLEWHYADLEGSKYGPISLSELREKFTSGQLTEQSRVWAQGLDGWKSLADVAQLKWTLLASGPGLLNESQMAVTILDTLIAICDFYPSRDSTGAVIRPLPRIKRRLSEGSCLPHVVQLLLTYDPPLVERVALLMCKVLDHNPATSRLYLTGAFYFLLMYSGSNVLHVARLLSQTHLQQAFRSDDRRTALLQRSFLGQLLPAAMVCFLDNHGPEKFAQILLGEFDTPEAIWSAEMRRLLAQKLAAHVADFSPRLRSNTRAIYQYCPMPAVSYPQLTNELFCNIYYLKNLCDIQRFSNWPIRDPVQLLRDILDAWKEEVERQPNTMSSSNALAALELNESQLQQLKEDHPDAPIDPASGLHSAVSAAIRKAYFRLAARFHPDKNPEGRERFEAINRAYEFLCGETNRSADGPDPVNIRLMLQAQSILFRQCGSHLQAYKYAGYPMLVRTLRMETEDDKLFSKSCPLLAHACETAFHTIKCSALNAEELRREGGLEILQQAFARCVSVLGTTSPPECVAAQVCTNIVRCFTGAAAFPACRRRLLQLRAIGGDLARLLQLSHLTRLCLCTVQCVSAFAANAHLTAQLVGSGALHSLMLFLFRYDYTLEEGGVESNHESNQQELANQLAKVALIALARLAGELSTEEVEAAESEEKLLLTEAKDATMVNEADMLASDQPPPTTAHVHAQVQACLAALLTPYLSRQLGVANAAHLLKTLTSNQENPYLIWDNGTRAELIDFLQRGQQACGRSSESLTTLSEQCNQFVYTAHRKELLIGEVFVRVYNLQPMFALLQPKQFTVALLDFIGSQAQYFHSAQVLQHAANVAASAQANGDLIDLSPADSRPATPDTPQTAQRVANMETALQALCNVIKYNAGVENACIGHFRLLFSLLRIQRNTRLQLLSVQVLSAVSGSAECVEDIASSEVLSNLLLLVRPRPVPPSKPSDSPKTNGSATPLSSAAEQRALIGRLSNSVLEVLLPLMANSRLVREALKYGAVLYLLEQFCVGGGAATQQRERCAELLGKMSADKLVGPKVRLQLGRFLPPLFIDAMSDSTSGAVQLFDTNQENPELIWNDASRSAVVQTLRQLATQLAAAQLNDSNTPWEVPEQMPLLSADPTRANELQVAGVYVRLFVANPGWLLRRPKQFLTELFEQLQRMLQFTTEQIAEEEPRLKMLGAGTSALLNAQPALMELIPAMGFVPTLLDACNSSRPVVAVSCCVQLLDQLSLSKACVDAMLQHRQLVTRLEDAIRVDRGLAGSVCDCLLRVLRVEPDQLMSQAMAGRLIPLLLQLLDEPQTGSASKAQVVRLLKEMCESGAAGEQLKGRLDQTAVWKEFRDQKHDLFISTQPAAAGYIQGAVPNVAGYLTQGTANSADATLNPPPIDDY